MDIYQLAYLMALISMVAGLLEFQIMRGYTGDMYYKEYYITNAKQVIQATKAIFDDNQSLFVAFSYSFVFLSAIVLITLYTYINGTLTDYAYYWSLVSIGLILLHVLVPYKLTYLNLALEAMKRDVDFETFIKNNLMFFKKKKDLQKIKIDTKELLKDFKDLTSKDYEKYLELVNFFKKFRETIKPLPKNQFNKYIGSFQDNEIIVLDQNNHTESVYLNKNKITFIEVDPTMKHLFFKMFVPQSFTTLLLIRFAEVPMFFIIFLYLLQIQK